MPSSDYITLGGGKLYIDKFDENGKPTGKFEYFGLTTGISISTDIEKLEHTNTEGKMQAIDKTIIKKQSASMSWTSDEISPEMLSRAFLGEINKITGESTLSFTNAKAGDFFDLNTYGGTVTVNSGGTALEKDKDYKIDEKSGMLEVLLDKNIKNGTLEVQITGGAEKQSIGAFKNAKLEARLLFIGDVACGNAMKVLFHKCNISQDGEFALKGDEWLSIGFKADILKDETRKNGDQFFSITAI